MLPRFVLLVFLVFGSSASVVDDNARLRKTNQALMKAVRALSEQVAVDQEEQVAINEEEEEVGGQNWFTMLDRSWLVNKQCKWYGTSPSCNGACPSHLEQVKRGTVDWKDEANRMNDPKERDNFGSNCWFNTKKSLCCERVKTVMDSDSSCAGLESGTNGKWYSTSSTGIFLQGGITQSECRAKCEERGEVGVCGYKTGYKECFFSKDGAVQDYKAANGFSDTTHLASVCKGYQHRDVPSHG